MSGGSVPGHGPALARCLGGRSWRNPSCRRGGAERLSFDRLRGINPDVSAHGTDLEATDLASRAARTQRDLPAFRLSASTKPATLFIPKRAGTPCPALPSDRLPAIWFRIA